jgi:hypothetical protein
MLDPAYRRLVDSGHAIPVHVELPADLDTALSAYIKLGGARGFVLESAGSSATSATGARAGSSPTCPAGTRARARFPTPNGSWSSGS